MNRDCAWTHTHTHTHTRLRYNALFVELWDTNHVCQQAFNTEKGSWKPALWRTVLGGRFVGHSNTTDGPFSFHINKDKGLEAYGGPNFPLLNSIPLAHCRQINWATWQEDKVLGASRFAKSWLVVRASTSQSLPNRGLATLQLQLRQQLTEHISTTSDT